MLSATLGRPDQRARYLWALLAPTGPGGRVAAISQARPPVNTLTVDNRAGALAMARELAALGYSRFGVLASPDDVVTARDRRGFEQGVAQAGGAPPVVGNGAFHP